jgi:acetolactate synthase-1/2/3 large subunit
VIPDDCTVIQVDIEPEEIGRNRNVQLGLVGDVHEAIAMFNERAPRRAFEDHKRWIEALVAARDGARDLHSELMWRVEPPIHQARLAREIADFLDADSILVADGGDTAGWMSEQAIVESAGRYLSHGYLGCLGVGIPFGLAAKLAHPEAKVLTVTGDGSVGLNFSEFDTAVRHQIPLVVVVNNDQGWGMIRHGQERMFGSDRVVGAELGPTRYDQAAAGLGAYAECVTDAEEIGPALERAFASGEPACINVMTDPGLPHLPPPRRKSAKPMPAATKQKPDADVELPYYGKRKLRS